MSRTYNVIDADGHVLEPLDLWDDYIDPAVSRARAEAGQGQGRQGAPAPRGEDPRQPGGLRRHRRSRRPAGHGRRRRDGIRGRTQGRLRPARAHSRHGPGRHRRRLPLSEPRPVRRRRHRSRLRRRDVPCLQPLARRLLQALSRPPVRHRHAADAVDRRWRSRRCASPARSSASAAASCGPIRTTTARCTRRTTSRSGARRRSSISAIGFHEGGNSGMPTVGVDRFDGRGAQHIISHTMEMMLACMSVIWGGVCERHPKLRVGFLESGGGWIAPWLDRMDRHFDDKGFNDSGLKTRPSELFRRNCWISFEPVEGSHRRAGRLYRPAQDPVGDRLSAPRRLLPRRAADAEGAA